jgi:hypothetical protein
MLRCIQNRVPSIGAGLLAVVGAACLLPMVSLAAGPPAPPVLLSGGEEPPPSGGSYPDADTTGVYKANGTTMVDTCQTLCGGRLTASGSVTATANGQVIQCLDVNGSVTVDGPDNVTVRCNQMSTLYNSTNLSTNLVVENNDIDGGGTGGQKCVRFLTVAGTSDSQRAKIRFNDIQGCDDGIHMSGNYITVEGNWIHDIVGQTGPGCGGDCHSDGIQCWGETGVIIRNNRIDVDTIAGTGDPNSAMFLVPGGGGGSGSLNDLILENNWIDGGGSHYPIYLTKQASATCPESASVVNNVWEAGSWGGAPMQFCDQTTCCYTDDHAGTWSNNRDSSGTPIN